MAGHTPRSGLQGAVAARLNSIEHIEGFVEAFQRDSGQFKVLVQQMAANQLYTCPDIYWYQVTGLQYPAERLQSLPGLAYVEPRIRNQWQGWWQAKHPAPAAEAVNPAQAQTAATLRTYRRAFRLMQQAGVQFLVSPGDGPFVIPGFSMAEELGLLVANGLSNYEALRAATYNAATWLGQPQRGTLEPGKSADLVLLDANPLLDIANVKRVSGVILNGRWLPLRQLLPKQP